MNFKMKIRNKKINKSRTKERFLDMPWMEITNEIKIVYKGNEELMFKEWKSND